MSVHYSMCDFESLADLKQVLDETMASATAKHAGQGNGANRQDDSAVVEGSAQHDILIIVALGTVHRRSARSKRPSEPDLW